MEDSGETCIPLCVESIFILWREAIHLAGCQANLGVRLQSCSHWMEGLSLHKRF